MRMLCLLVVALAAAAAPPAPAEKPAAAPPAAAGPKAEEPPAYEPTSHYTLRDVEGWKVYVHNRLLEGEKKALGDETLKVLAAHLYDVSRMVPRPAIDRLREVRIWLEADNPKVKCACYHPSRGWLEKNGFNPEKAKCIEIGNPVNFLGWTHHQRAMVLHELAHAYHHQVLGYDQPDIRAAYKKAMVLHELAHAYHHQVLGYDQPDIKAAFKKAQDAKSYESVLYYDGSKKRAYGMNNDQEYFAELTEGYFGTNDIFPFVRAEVKEHDPQMFEVLKKVWGR